MGLNYANLGIVHEDRGDVATARAMYKRSIELFREAGATLEARKVIELSNNLGRN